MSEFYKVYTSEEYVDSEINKLIDGTKTVMKSTTATKLTTARTITASGAVTCVGRNFDGSSNININVTGLKEAYLEYGGKQLAGTVSPLDAAMSAAHRANRFAFMNTDDIVIEYTTDGETWSDYGATSNMKTCLVTQTKDTNMFYIGKRLSANTDTVTTDYKLRVTLTARQASLYTKLRKLLIYISTNGATGSTVFIEGAHNGSDDNFVTLIPKTTITGWSGWNVINFTSLSTTSSFGINFGGNDTQTGNYRKIRLTFEISGLSESSANNLQVMRIYGYGETMWTYPSYLSYADSLFSIGTDKSATFPAAVIAPNFTGLASKATADASGNNIENTYVKNTAYATQSQAGIVKTEPSLGTDMTGTNKDTLYIVGANTSDIDTGTNQYKPIVPSNLEYAVKSKTDTEITADGELPVSGSAVYNQCASVGVATGENIVKLNNQIPGISIIDYSIYGNSYQETRSGKNLLPYPHTDITKTVNGITFTDNGDGTITVNGTATGEARYTLGNDIAINNTAVISGCPANGSATTYFIQIVQTENGTDKYYADTGNGKSMTYTTLKTVYIAIKSGTTVSNLVFKPQIEEGTTATDYEQYGVMPSPEYPSEIQSVGDLVTDEADEHYGKYRISISCEPKNLVNISGRTVVDNWASSNTSKRILTGNQIIQGYAASNYVHKSNVTISEVTDESISIISKSNAYGVGLDVEICPNTEYYLSGASGGIGRIMVGLYDKDGYFLKTVNATDNFTFTTPDGAQWAVIALTATANIEGSIGSQIKFYDIQLERGTAKTEYERGGITEKAYIYIDEPLRKVGDYADYVDYENQVVVRNVKELIFDGVSVDKKFTSFNSDANNRAALRIYDSIENTKYDNTYGFTNYFQYEGTAYKDAQDIIGYAALGTYVYFRFGSSSIITDIISANEQLANWNAEDNPLKFYYPLATPTEEPITVPELTTPNSSVMHISSGTAISPTVNVTYYLNTTSGKIESKYITRGEFDSVNSSYVTDKELERLQYYGDKDIIPSNSTYFTVNETGEAITGLTDVGKEQTELIIPYEINGITITRTGEYAFTECTNIVKVIIPNTIETLGSRTFNACTNISDVTIVDGVKVIDDYAFYSCNHIEHINIPDSVTYIGAGVFSSCIRLKNIRIPQNETLTGINNYTFSSCDALETVYIPNTIETFGDNIFDNSPNVNIYCEQGSYAETYAKNNSFNIVYTDMNKVTLDKLEDDIRKVANINEIFDGNYHNFMVNNGILTKQSKSYSYFVKMLPNSKYDISVINGSFNRFRIYGINNEPVDGEVPTEIYRTDTIHVVTGDSYSYINDGTYKYLIIFLAYNVDNVDWDFNIKETIGNDEGYTICGKRVSLWEDIENVHDKFDFLVDEQTVQPYYADYEIGGLVFGTGANDSKTDRIRTSGFLDAGNIQSIVAESGYKFFPVIYDANQVYISSTIKDWLTGTFLVPEFITNYPEAKYIRWYATKTDGFTSLDDVSSNINVTAISLSDGYVTYLDKKIESVIDSIGYDCEVTMVKNSGTISNDGNTLCLVNQKQIYKNNEMPDVTGYLYLDTYENKLYYSATTPDNPIYLCDWKTDLAYTVTGSNAYSKPERWHFSITKDGDIICLLNYVRAKPIIYPHDDYNNPVAVDGLSSNPYGLLTQQSIVQMDDGTFYFGEYALHSLSGEQNNDRRNIWKVSKPYTDASNWTIDHSFKHVYVTSNVSDEPNNEIGHIHSVTFDWYTNTVYANTGDIGRHVRIWRKKLPDGTWEQCACGVGNNQTTEESQKFRVVNLIYTKDACWWATDSFNVLHNLYKATRDDSGDVDFSTTKKIINLESFEGRSTQNQQPTYINILMRNPNGILFIDRAEERTDRKLDIVFYSFDTEKAYICKTFEKVSETNELFTMGDKGEIANRLGLPNQCAVGYQPFNTDYVMIGGATFIRMNQIDIFNNSPEHYVGALKLKISKR